MSEPTSKYSTPAPAGSLDDHCLTIGPEGRVKAEIRARQVVIQGSVSGNIVAREKVDIRRTGQIIGDIVAASVAIEDGAYLKGSIDIKRKEAPGTASGTTSGK